MIYLSNLEPHDHSINGTSVAETGPTFTIVACLLGVFGNVLAIVVLVKSAKKHKWKVFYKMITTLAIIDLLGIITTSPIAMAVYSNGLKWIGGQGLCNYFSVMLIFSGLSTCLLIGAMALDRYMAIVFPFRYRTVSKDKLVNYVIPGILIFSACVSFLPVFGLGENIVHYPGSWCFPNFHGSSTVDSMFSYFYSCLILLLILMTAILNIWATVRLIKGKRSKVRRGSNTNKTKRHVDVYIMVLLVAIFVVFAVCWSPFMTRIIINQVGGHPYDLAADLLTLRMASLNQILDPWVYLLFRRETLRKFVHYIARKRTSGEGVFSRIISITSQHTLKIQNTETCEKVFTVSKPEKDSSQNRKDSDFPRLTDRGEITEL